MYLVSGGIVIAPREFVQFGPIFLDQLFCTDSDTTLQECNRGISSIGLTTCNHTDDVWVQCLGMQSILALPPWILLVCDFRY